MIIFLSLQVCVFGTDWPTLTPHVCTCSTHSVHVNAFVTLSFICIQLTSALYMMYLTEFMVKILHVNILY